MAKGDKAKDVSKSRGTWGSHFEFILSSMGYAVGLGNVWRFPYMVYDNGGGAFLIPYFLMLVLAAIPVMFLEVSFGQFSSLGCISCWKISPLFKGVGIAMAVVSSYFCLYYNLIIAYTIRYMVVSFKNPLPWVSCNNTWNTPNCYTTVSLSQDNLTKEDVQLVTYNPETPNTSFNEGNYSGLASGPRRIRASEEYWKFGVLNVSEGLEDIGSIQWPLLLSFLCAWILVYLCIIKGVKSSGKVVYFTATFPYFVLVVLFIRGVTLDGAMKGILFFLTPDFDKLLSANVWKAAATQVFFSYGAGWGGIHTLSSYNKFSSNTLRASGLQWMDEGIQTFNSFYTFYSITFFTFRELIPTTHHLRIAVDQTMGHIHRAFQIVPFDTLLISMSCALTSIFSGVVIFSIIGFMAHDSNQDIQDVIAAGPGLAFVAYPEAVSRIFVPQLWSFLFFFMLLTVGIDSQFVTLETLITAFIDELESKFPGKVRRWKSWIILLVCIIMFLVGLPFVTRGGTYVMTLFNWYSAGFTPLLLALIELLVISYAYGVDRFLKDVESMLGFGLSMYWKVCWMFVSPIIIVGIMIFSFIDYTPAVNGSYTFPPWAEAIGWTLTLSSLLYVIGYAVYYLATSEGTLLERFKKSITPSKDWGPANNIDRINADYAPLPGQKDEMESEAIQFDEAPPAYKETTFVDVAVNTYEECDV